MKFSFNISIWTIVHLMIAFASCTVDGCQIHGVDSGVCTNRYLPETYEGGDMSKREARRMAQSMWANATDDDETSCNGEHCMPFCGKYIANYYPPCVPNNEAFQLKKKDRNFPNGRRHMQTTAMKDRWVEKQVTTIIAERIAIETNKTARKLGIDEYGTKGKRTKVRFHKNKACQKAYERYACWVNFPRCDEFGDSMPLCQSVCENFFRECGYENDLWQCDNNVIDGNYDMTKTSAEDFFPGEPFRVNEKRKEVCTPNIKGGATREKIPPILLWMSTLLMISLYNI